MLLESPVWADKLIARDPDGLHRCPASTREQLNAGICMLVRSLDNKQPITGLQAYLRNLCSRLAVAMWSLNKAHISIAMENTVVNIGRDPWDALSREVTNRQQSEPQVPYLR